MSTYTTKTSQTSQLQQILSGLNQYFPSATITLGGTGYTLTGLTQLIQPALDAITASAQAKAAYSTQVQVERNAVAKISPILRLLKNFVVAYFGDARDASSKLGAFGYSPRKSSKKTLVTKVEAMDKTLATREARHTLGKKQKAKIKGAAAPEIAPAAASAPNPKG
jgi:hypothetical protein